MQRTYKQHITVAYFTKKFNGGLAKLGLTFLWNRPLIFNNTLSKLSNFIYPKCVDESAAEWPSTKAFI